MTSPEQQKRKTRDRVVALLHSRWFICFILFAVTVAVFSPALRHDFSHYDDHEYVVENSQVRAGLTAEGVHWAFTRYHSANWHPLTWISHMLDVELFGMNAMGHHLGNILIHGINAVLVFLLLRKLTGAHWRSVFVAAFFALHPLRVESVAWIAERKDVLCAFFGFLTILAYAEYVERTKGQRSKRRLYYGISLVLFSLGLMSKPMLVTWPFLLLLLDWWPLNRFRLSPANVSAPQGNQPRMLHLIAEKIPFFALAVLSSAVTFAVQNSAGAVSALQKIPIAFRLCNAALAYFRYIANAVWPTELAVLYPIPHELGMFGGIIAAAFLLIISLVAFVFRNRAPYLFTGWFWYFGTLVPVIGLVQVGSQSMADRYTYIPMLGLTCVLAWGICDATKRWKAQSLLWIPAAAVLIFSVLLTRVHIAYWKTDETLFARALAVTRDNHVAHVNLAALYADENRFEEALKHLQQAEKLEPDSEYLLVNLGNVALRQENYPLAELHYRKAVSLHPSSSAAHEGLGYSLLRRDQFTNSIPHFKKALELKPDFGQAHANLAVALEGVGDLPGALDHYRRAHQLRVEPEKMLVQAGQILKRQGKTEEAIEAYNAALQIQPKYFPALYQLGVLQRETKQFRQALESFNRAYELEPRNVELLNQMGIAASEGGTAEMALRYFREALQHEPGSVSTLNNLALSLEKAGRVDDALNVLKSHLEKAPEQAAAVHLQIAGIRERLGNEVQAIHHYEQSVGIDPANYIGWARSAELFFKKGDLKEAKLRASKACDLQPANIALQEFFGKVLVHNGDQEEASRVYAAILKLDPNHVEAHNHLGSLSHRLGQLEKAMFHWREAIRLDATWPAPLNNLAWMLATSRSDAIRNGTEAVRLSEQAIQLAGTPNPSYLATLAAGYAEAGNFEKAIAVSNQAIQLAKERSDAATVSNLEQRVALFEAGKPFRQ